MSKLPGIIRTNPAEFAPGEVRLRLVLANGALMYHFYGLAADGSVLEHYSYTGSHEMRASAAKFFSIFNPRNTSLYEQPVQLKTKE